MILPVLTAINDSKLVTGTTKLFEDATTALLVLAPLAAIAFTIFFMIRMGMADEQDQKQWKNRIKTAVFSAIGAVVASVVIKVLMSYFE